MKKLALFLCICGIILLPVFSFAGKLNMTVTQTDQNGRETDAQRLAGQDDSPAEVSNASIEVDYGGERYTVVRESNNTKVYKQYRTNKYYTIVVDRALKATVLGLAASLVRIEANTRKVLANQTKSASMDLANAANIGSEMMQRDAADRSIKLWIFGFAIVVAFLGWVAWMKNVQKNWKKPAPTQQQNTDETCSSGPMGLTNPNQPKMTEISTDQAIQDGCDIKLVNTPGYAKLEVTHTKNPERSVADAKEKENKTGWTLGGGAQSKDVALGRK